MIQVQMLTQSDKRRAPEIELPTLNIVQNDAAGWWNMQFGLKLFLYFSCWAFRWPHDLVASQTLGAFALLRASPFVKHILPSPPLQPIASFIKLKHSSFHLTDQNETVINISLLLIGIHNTPHTYNTWAVSLLDKQIVRLSQVTLAQLDPRGLSEQTIPSTFHSL